MIVWNYIATSIGIEEEREDGKNHRCQSARNGRATMKIQTPTQKLMVSQQMTLNVPPENLITTMHNRMNRTQYWSSVLWPWVQFFC